MAEKTKFIGAKISDELFWDIKRELLERQESVNDAITVAICVYLGLEVSKYGIPVGANSGGNETVCSKEGQK